MRRRRPWSKCRNGHKYTPENTAERYGYQCCKICRNARQRAVRARRGLTGLLQRRAYNQAWRALRVLERQPLERFEPVSEMVE